MTQQEFEDGLAGEGHFLVSNGVEGAGRISGVAIALATDRADPTRKVVVLHGGARLPLETVVAE